MSGGSDAAEIVERAIQLGGQRLVVRRAGLFLNAEDDARLAVDPGIAALDLRANRDVGDVLQRDRDARGGS